MSQDLDKKKEELEDLEDQLMTLEDDLQFYMDEHHIDDKDDLEVDLNQISHQLANLKDQGGDENNKLISDLENRKKEIEDRLTRITELEGGIEEYQEKIAEFDDKIADLRLQIRMKHQEIHEIEEDN